MALLHLGSEPRVCFPIYNRNPRFFLSSTQTFSLLHMYKSSVLPSIHVLRRLGCVFKNEKELGQHEKGEAKCSLSPHLPQTAYSAAVSPAPVAQPREQVTTVIEQVAVFMEGVTQCLEKPGMTHF